MHIRTGFLLVLLAVVFGGLSGCASAPKGRLGAEDFVAVPNAVQRGMASWYGGKFRGRKTASGEIFNPDHFTAAHRTATFGTIVEVRNLKNNRTVLVRINDRGPFIEGRVIDLSERAARELGMIAAGLVPVEIRVMRRR